MAARRAGSGRVAPKKSTSVVVPSAADEDANLREWALPEGVTIAIAELAETAQEGLLALAVGTGLRVMDT